MLNTDGIIHKSCSIPDLGLCILNRNNYRDFNVSNFPEQRTFYIIM